MANSKTVETRLAEIRSEVVSRDTNSLGEVWAVGKLLAEAKSITERGRFGEFVGRECGWSMSYAARLLRIYSSSPDSPPEGVGVSVYLCCLSLEEKVREQFNAIAREAELTAAEAALLAKQVKERDDRLAELSARLESGPGAGESIKAELSEELSALRAEAKAARESAAEVESINSDLQARLAAVEKSARVAEAKAAEAKRLESQLSESNRVHESTLAELSSAREMIASLEVRVKEAAVASVPVQRVEVKVPTVPADYESLKSSLAEFRSRAEHNGALVDELRAELSELRSKEPEVREVRVEVPVPSVELSAEVEQLRALVAKLQEAESVKVLKLERVVVQRRLLLQRVRLLESFIEENGLAVPVRESGLEEVLR